MKLLAVVLSSCVLVACGGGGDVSAPTTSTTLTVTGTAATGLAIPGATITGKCKVGSSTTTTLADGSYTLAVKDGQLPCVLQITNPVDGVKLHTVVTGAGSAANANITPLTEMATARVLGSEPNVFFAAFNAAVATQKITTNTVLAAQTDIGLVLKGTVETASLGNFISAPLKAATQGSSTSGDAHDKLLDALKLKLSSSQVGTLATALASNQTTNAIKQTVTTMKGGGTSTVVAPLANAGVAQSVLKGATVTLDASTSSAATGKSLTYAWTLTSKPAGSTATLAAPTTAKSTFVADVAGAYVASVVVNDGTSASSASAVTVTASVANAAPVANAGVAQNVIAGSAVTLDGSASSDANSDQLTYAWTLTSKPAGSTAVFSSTTSAKPTFTANLAGTYVASLTVNDGKVNSTTVTVSITAAVANVAPVANAGVAQNVVAGSAVTLDGSASSDANSDPLTYAWTLTSKPAGSSAVLAASTSPKPTFTADMAGTYVATLTVNDSKVSSVARTITVTGNATTTLWMLGAFNGLMYKAPTPFTTTAQSYLRGVTQTAGGYYHLLTLKSDTSLSGHGSDQYGQLCGQAATISTGVVAVAAGYYHTIFLKSDGTVWGCGLNSYGQLGDGSLTNKTTPVQIASQATAIAASDYTSSYLKQDGTLWRTDAISNPTPGQVGKFTQRAANVKTISAYGRDPVYLSTEDTLIDAGKVIDTNVSKISVTWENVYYIKTDGSLWGYGANGSGQLGNGKNVPSAFPVLIATSVTKVGSTSNMVWFLKTNGDLFATGDNRWGTLNSNTASFLYVWTPVLVANNVSATFSSAPDSYVIFFLKDF